MNILNIAIGWVMKLCYSISFNNYILTLFFFALVMQVVLFPFGIKQQKSSVKLASIRPKEQAIRNQYRGRNDQATQQKMNAEIQEMYKREGYNPMAGCLPLLVQFPIIFAIFGVARMPLTYTTDLGKSSVGENKYVLKDFYYQAYDIIGNYVEAYEGEKTKLEESKNADGADVAAIDAKIADIDKRIKNLKDTLNKKENNGIMYTTDGYREIKLIKFMKDGVSEFKEYFTDENGNFTIDTSKVPTVLGDKVSLSDIKNGTFAFRMVAKQDALNAYEGEKVYDFNKMLADKGVYTLNDNSKNENGAVNLPDFDFIAGTSTLDQPSFKKFDWLIIVPVLVFVSSFLSGEYTRKLTTANAPKNQPNPANSGFMRWGMPLMSTYFAFTFPAAIGIYWIFRSIFAVGQQFIVSKMYPAPVLSEEEMKVAVNEEKKAKKRKKIVTIEVDEDDNTYDELAISEERAEKIRRRREKQLRDEKEAEENGESKGDIEKPTLKDD